MTLKRGLLLGYRLPRVIEAFNNTTLDLTLVTPVEAINLQKVKHNDASSYQRGVGVREKPLSMTAMYRFLYQPGELEGGTKHATDPIWSLGVYYIDHYDVKLAQPITYYLARGSEVEARSISQDLLSATTVDPPKRSFVASEFSESCTSWDGITSGR